MTGHPKTSRRSAIQYLCSSAAAGCLSSSLGEQKSGLAKFPIGACDWTIGKQQDIAAFDVARQIGLEGLQVSLSTPGSKFDLRDKKVHCKQNKAFIGGGDVDFAKFRLSLEKAGYRDWLIIEGSKPEGAEVVEAYRKNFVTLDGLFCKQA